MIEARAGWSNTGGAWRQGTPGGFGHSAKPGPKGARATDGERQYPRIVGANSIRSRARLESEATAWLQPADRKGTDQPQHMLGIGRPVSFAPTFTNRQIDRLWPKMKIDFAMLERLEAAGATAKVIIEILRPQFDAYEAKKKNDANTKREQRIATICDNDPTTSDILRHFATFWKSYPKRAGSNPKAAAQKLFEAAVAAGADPLAIINGAKKFAEQERAKIGTPYIPQTVKWLRARQWVDYLQSEEIQQPSGFYASFSSQQLIAWDKYERANGQKTPRDKHGGWWFPNEWPPGVEERTCTEQ